MYDFICYPFIRIISIWFSALPSITRGVCMTAALIVLARLLFRKVLSAKAKYYLWLLLALRLVLPVVPASSLSLLNYLPDGTASTASAAPSAPAAPQAPDAVLWELDPEIAPKAPEVASPLTSTTLTGTSGMVEEAPTAPEAPAAPQFSEIFTPELLMQIWLAGIGIMLAIYLILYLATAIQLKRLPVCTDPDTLRTFLQLKRVCGIKGHVRLAVGGAGMLGGLFHSTIVLPVERHGEDVTPIIVHELLHYKYRDLRLAAIYRILKAVYWFNPVVWLCFHWAKLDCEAACDQRVLETGLVRPEHYAETLYEEGLLHTKKGPLLQTTFGGNRHSLKRRIRHIAKFKSPKVWVTVLAVVLAVIVGACTMTGANPKAAIQEAIVGAEEADRLMWYGYYPSGELTTANLTDEEIAARITDIDQILHRYYSSDARIFTGVSGDEGANPALKDYEYHLRNIWTEPGNLDYWVDGGVLSCKLSRLQVDGDTAQAKVELVTYFNAIRMNEDGKYVLDCGGGMQEDLTAYMKKENGSWKLHDMDNPGGAEWMHAWWAEISGTTYDTFEEALTMAQATDRRNECPYKNLDTDFPHISLPPVQPSTDADNTDSEEPSLSDITTKYSTFSPYVLSDESLTYENTAWDMLFSEVVAAQNLDMDTWKSSDFGQPTIYLDQPLSEHPEVERITYTFNIKNPAVFKELTRVEIDYDPEQISYESLIAQRTQELGEPNGTYENSTFWTIGDIQLAIYPGKHDLQERLTQYVDRSEELPLTQEQLNAFLADIQPPNGHYGWTFDQHVEAGLLDPEQGEMEPGGSSDVHFQVFHTEVELGGYTVDAEYCFTETMANWDSGQMVLSEVHIDPPSDIPLSQWVAQFSQPWSDRMIRLPESTQWNSTLVVNTLLTDTQREYIAQQILDAGQVATTLEEAYQYLNNWNMAINFYEAARGWVFNGTGTALYATAQTIE